MNLQLQSQYINLKSLMMISYSQQMLMTSIPVSLGRGEHLIVLVTAWNIYFYLSVCWGQTFFVQGIIFCLYVSLKVRTQVKHLDCLIPRNVFSRGFWQKK